MTHPNQDTKKQAKIHFLIEAEDEGEYSFTFEPKNPSAACSPIRIEGHTQNAGTYRHDFRFKNTSDSRRPSTDAHSVRHLTHDTFYRPQNRVATQMPFPESLLRAERDVRSTDFSPTQPAKRAEITTPIGSPGSTVPDSLDGSFTQGPKRQRDLEDEPQAVDVLKKRKVTWLDEKESMPKDMRHGDCEPVHEHGTTNDT
jgi:hypothetical protein